MGLNKSLSTKQSTALAEALFARLTGPINPEMHPKQREFVLTGKHHAALIGGISSGKTLGGCIRAVRASQGWIGSKRIQTPNLGIVTAPTFPMLQDATLRVFMEVAGELVVNYNKNEHLATMRNGSEILFRSTEHPDRLRGPSIAWWFGDEAALYRPNVRQIMLGRLRQFARLGYNWIATTPKGRNWVWKAYVQAERPDYYVQTVTTHENVFLDDSLLQMWDGEYTGDFARQELMAEFVAFEGLVYPEFSQAQHVTRERPTQFREVIAGVDWGFVHPGVILVYGLDGDGRMCQVQEAFARQRRVEDWVQVGKQLRDVWGIERFLCDPSEPDYIRLFREAGLKAEPADNSVLPGIQHVKDRLVVRGDGRPRLTIYTECVQTISQFEQYQWAENRYGMRDAPVKANDDAMDALRYACRGADYQKFKPLKAEARRYA